MNKFTKRLLALGLVLSIVTGIGSVSVFAKPYTSGQIHGYVARGYSNISQYSANATTTYEKSGLLSVNSTYYYVNVKTLAANHVSKDRLATKSPTVTFSAPKNCRSIKISSSHRVEAYYSIWTAYTDAEYR